MRDEPKKLNSEAKKKIELETGWSAQSTTTAGRPNLRIDHITSFVLSLQLELLLRKNHPAFNRGISIINWSSSPQSPLWSVSGTSALEPPRPPRSPTDGRLVAQQYLAASASAEHKIGMRGRSIPISTVSPFISPSIVSLRVKRAMWMASSNSKPSVYLFSKNVFALVALLPMAVAFQGK